MKVLVVCLLAVLGCSVAEGATVSKCELKQKLTDKLGARAASGKLDLDKFVAKIVCHAENGTEFNTNAVSERTIATEHNTRSKRNSAGIFDLAELEHIPTTVQPPTSVWTLYGLFQLSNHLVCNDGTTETPNICKMDCDKLVDDDIEDDLSCVLTLIDLLVEHGFTGPNVKDLMAMIKLIFQDECRNVQPSEYFAECT